MQVFTFDFVPYGKDLTGRLKYPVGRSPAPVEIDTERSMRTATLSNRKIISRR